MTRRQSQGVMRRSELMSRFRAESMGGGIDVAPPMNAAGTASVPN